MVNSSSAVHEKYLQCSCNAKLLIYLNQSPFLKHVSHYSVTEYNAKSNTSES